MLVTGPTGSGKTTTLYAALERINDLTRNILTVEDPIEYHLDGVTQVQVHPEIGTTFAALLRSLLRQDPDVIMIGELRDPDTARMATEASMTGHLVISSLHSNGAVDAAARLVDLGVERHAVANALVGVLHQRLVRRSCASCAQRFEYPEPIMAELVRVGAFRENETPRLRRSNGCSVCDGTGFKGRIALYELLAVNEAVRDAIAENADLPSLRSVCAAATIGLARYAGVLLASGMTAPGDVLAALQHATP
jgi:general secretion pathway protein E